MSWYVHIMICWEGGHVLGYADQEKIRSIAKKYYDQYKKLDDEQEKFFEEMEEKKRNGEKETDDDIEKYRYYNNLTDNNKMVSIQVIDILESIASGKAYFKGNKGCLWMAGGIYNGGDGYYILEDLKDFFKELYDNKCYGIGDVICFTEDEQGYCARIHILDVGKMEIHEVEPGERWCWGLNW